METHLWKKVLRYCFRDHDGRQTSTQNEDDDVNDPGNCRFPTRWDTPTLQRGSTAAAAQLFRPKKK